MKMLFSSACALLILLTSCSKKEVASASKSEKTDTADVQINYFKTDFVRVTDSLKIDENLTAKYDVKVLVFPNITNKTLQDSIYSNSNLKLKSYSKESIKRGLKARNDQYYEDTKTSLKDWKPSFKQTWDQTSDMKLFSTNGDFMTIQYTGSGYTGGAHGYYNEIYKVYDVKTNKTLQLADVIKSRDPKIWSRILMNHFLKNDLENGQAQMLLVKEIPLNSNFYFNKENLYFLYNQYEIAAYAAGPVLIKIPFSEIKPFLNPEFRKKMKLN